MSFIISIIWILTIVSLNEGQTLPEGNPEHRAACAGAVLRMACPSARVIAVKDVRYGTKLTSVCALSNNSDACCQYDAGDCFDPPYTGTAEIAACSGYNVCNKDKADINAVRAGQEDSSSCGDGYPGLTHYLVMDYYCIPESRIGLLSSASLQETGSLLYIQNTDYPTGPIRAAETTASCSVETTSCSSQVNVYFVHFELSDGGGSCTGTQNLQVDDKGVFQTYTCSNNTDYTINLKLTSSSNYLTLMLNNPGGTNDGKFKIGFEATESAAPLTVKCPAVEQKRCMDCPQLDNILNGTVSTIDGLSTEKTANYSCESEFDLLGNTTRTCLENGQWSGQEPICQIKVCSPLPDPENGNVIATGESVGQTASYECDSGYSLNGTVLRICKANTMWSGIAPTCALIKCPDLNNPPNGIVSTDGGSTVGKMVTYKCNYGYKLEGVESRTCQSNETWTGEEPNCTKIVCPTLSNPGNGTVRTDNGVTVEQTATYECNSGYSLSGDSSRICQINATWSGDEPTCALIEACPTLVNPENGQVSSDDHTIGSTATYTCSKGFIISNNTPRICQDGFTWSGTQPSCTKRKLGDPCTSEADCSDAIPESTCKNETCVCPEDSEVKDNLCVRSGESKPGGDDGMPIWVWILVGVVGAIIIVLIIAVICYLQRRKDYQPKDDSDQYKMVSENTNNMKKDISNAFDNNGYQQSTIKNNNEVANEVVNEVENKDETTDRKKKAEQQSNWKVELPVDKDSEQVIVSNDTMHLDKDVKEINSLPHKSTEPPNQDKTGLQEHINSDHSNEGNEDSRNPKKTEQQVNKVIELPVDKNSESVIIIRDSQFNNKDDQEFNSFPDMNNALTGEEQNELSRPEPTKAQNSSIDELKHSETAHKDSVETTEEDIKDAVHLDERFSEYGKVIKDVTTALFRSASIVKKDLEEKASLAGFSIDTSENGEWSKGLVSAAKEVLAAIFSMCSIANDMVEGKARAEKMNAATKEVKRATTALVFLHKIEGYSESDSVQELKTACDELNEAAESLLSSASSKYNTESETKPSKKKSIALEDSEVQKAMKRIEAQETVLRKQKELEAAQKAKALINEEQNRYQPEITEL